MQNEEILLGALDESTTSTKFIIFNNKGSVIEQTQIPHEQITPFPGWLEHNPSEILKNTWDAIEIVLKSLSQKGIDKQIKCLSVVNQRETIVAWDKNTGKPLYNAIVWCDTRTREIAERIKKSKGSKFFYRKRNGLPINTYFSAFKILWLLENIPEIKNNLENIYFGTIDTWIVWNLTGIYATDVSNASRTFLLNLQTVQWDEEILQDFGLKKENFPQIKPSVSDFGDLKQGPLKGVKISCVLGDQQAAALGHAITSPGEVKHTCYFNFHFEWLFLDGTGCFLVMNTGEHPIIKENSGMLTSILFQLGEKEKVIYALEGAIETGGNTINWLRDNFAMFEDFDQMMEIMSQIKEQGNVFFVPSFAGLFSPFWDDDVTGTIVGMTYHTTKAHMIRSVLEAICYRTKDVIDAMEKDSELNIPQLRIDGGLTVNQWLLQYQSDLLQKKLVRSKTTQSTALGGVFGAGIYYGIFNIDQLKEISQIELEVKPNKEIAQNLADKYQQWLKVIKQMLIKIE